MTQGSGWNSSQAIGIRLLFIILGWVIGVILFGTETKWLGGIPAFIWCGIAGVSLAILLFNDYFTRPPQNNQTPQTYQAPPQNNQTPQTYQQRICVKCFAPFNSGASFCPNCGNKLS